MLKTTEWKVAYICFLIWKERKKNPKANHLLFSHASVHIRYRPDCHHDSDVTDQMVQVEETQQ